MKPDKVIVKIRSIDGRKLAIVCREIWTDLRMTYIEVLSEEGKWREKREAEELFDDEKLKIEEE